MLRLHITKHIFLNKKNFQLSKLLSINDIKRLLFPNRYMWSNIEKFDKAVHVKDQRRDNPPTYPALFFAALLLLLIQIATTSEAEAEVIGQMMPPRSLTSELIKELPSQERATWTAYLNKSDQQRIFDMASLTAERADLAIISSPPVDGNGEKSMPLSRPADYYSSLEARHTADVILSFQTPAGGWGKNQPRDGELRKKGQSYVTHDSRGDLAASNPKAERWAYVGTIDNGATITELRFLARVSYALPDQTGSLYRTAIRRGIEYLLMAQYPNGGWPQVWPLDGGYHDAITFNDDALIDTVRLLSDVASAREFSFIETLMKQQAEIAVSKAQALILRLQVKVNGVPTIWGQQHDVISEEPCGARNFEPPALASAESTNILLYLMSLDKPSPEIVSAIHHAKSFFQSSAITGFIWLKNPDRSIGNRLLPQAGAGPLWARYIDLKTQKPIFGDRDRSIHDDVNEISVERRNGYSWFNTQPVKVLKSALE
jgi:PelA/Pel-15E family pectate lyase